MKLPLTGFMAILCLFTSAQYSEQITISDPDSISQQRAAISEIIFGDEVVPQFQVDSQVNKYLSVFSGVYEEGHMLNFEMGTVNLKYGFVSKICMFHPQKSNGLNITIIYHTGHGFNMLQEDLYVNYSSGSSEGSETNIKVIDFFLSKGFEVVGIDMPMFGLNRFPLEVTENMKTMNMYGHNDLFNLENPFSYFLSPVKSVVNFLEQQDPEEEFVMLGLSGGGWTTTLFSAIDTRIKLSFPVAGSIPIGLRTDPRDFGDLEQNFSTFYDKFNYSTLYFLGAAGSGRMQYQVLNKYDHCCFAFDGRKYWVDSVKKALQRNNDAGRFEFHFDTTALIHKISAVTVDTIYQNILRHLANDRFKPIPLVGSRIDNSICDNDSLLITSPGDSNIDYKWFRNGQPVGSDKSGQYIVRGAGIYYALVTNFSGAKAYTDTIVIKQNNIFQKPVVSFTNQMVASSYASGTHHWFRDGEPIPNESGSKITAKIPGRYTVLISDGNCTSDMSDAVDVGLVVFPNPAKSQLTVRTESDLGVIRYQVYNFLGQAVASGNFTGETKIHFPPGVGTGLFYLKLKGAGNWETTVKFWIKQY